MIHRVLTVAFVGVKILQTAILLSLGTPPYITVKCTHSVDNVCDIVTTNRLFFAWKATTVNPAAHIVMVTRYHLRRVL